MDKSYIGIDLGTLACKLLPVNEDGSTLYSVTKEYPLEFPRPGRSEQRPADWLYHAENSRIPEFNACITVMHNRSEYILNSFDVPYTNGFTEGCNNKTKLLKQVCFGVRNFDTFRNRILHCDLTC